MPIILFIKTIVQKFVLALLMSSFLMLSCQHSEEPGSSRAEQLQKKNQAASYNVQLGLAYLKQKDISRAKKKLLMALALNPGSADSNMAMAYFLEKTGDPQQAQVYYQKALLLAPNKGAELNNYGTFLCRLGKYKEAESYFLKAAQDLQYLHTAGAYENAGLCALAMPDTNKAEHFFIKALENDPQRRQSLYELVKVELSKQEAGKALSYLHQYHHLVWNDAKLLELSIESAQRLGKMNEEEEFKKRLLTLTQNFIGAKQHEYSIDG